MKTEHKKLLVGIFLLSVVLVALVPLVDLCIAPFLSSTSSAKDAFQYDLSGMLSGVSSEVLRAIVTIYLYAHTTGRGSSLRHAVWFGMLYTILVASLYLILGTFYFHVSNPLHFIIADSTILFVQGLVTGFVLYPVYKEKK